VEIPIDEGVSYITKHEPSGNVYLGNSDNREASNSKSKLFIIKPDLALPSIVDLPSPASSAIIMKNGSLLCLGGNKVLLIYSLANPALPSLMHQL
jgi:hypothetical protein